jgi:hypothetical protein
LVNGRLILPVCEAGEAAGAEAADGPAAGVESVGVEGLLPIAFYAEEVGFAEAVGAFFVAAVVAEFLELFEEVTNLLGERFGSSKIEGVLAAILGIGEPVVGPEAASVFYAVGRNHGAATLEDLGVGADEVEF